MVKKYIKNSILHPLSLFGVFFVLIALLFSASTLYKSMNHAKEIQRRDKITAEVSKASHVITKKDMEDLETDYKNIFRILMLHINIRIKNIRFHIGILT